MKKLAGFLALLICNVAIAQQQPTGVFGLDFTANNSQALSASNHLRLRYNPSTAALEQSVSGGAYTAIGGGATGNFVFTNNNMDLNNAVTMTIGGTAVAFQLGNASSDTLNLVAHLNSNLDFVKEGSWTIQTDASTTVGAAASTMRITAGNAAASDGITNAGVGNNLTLNVGAGGAASGTKNAGNGGVFSMNGGPGGAAAAGGGTAGAGGNTQFNAGAGGAATGTVAGANGGQNSLQGGAGGAASAGAAAGAGGAALLAGGAAGSNASGGGGNNGGTVTIRGGAATGAGTNGAVVIGATNTSSISLGVATTVTAALTDTITAIATAQTVGASLQNTTAATGGVTQQYSPMLEFLGHSWNTAADTTGKWAFQLQPTTAATPANVLAVYNAPNGGGYTKIGSFQQTTGGGFGIVSPNGSGVLTTDDSAGTRTYYGAVGFTLTSTTLTGSTAGGTVILCDGATASMQDPSGSSFFYNTNSLAEMAYGGGTLIVDNTSKATFTGLSVVIGARTAGNAFTITGNASNFSAQALFKDSNGNAHFGTDNAGLPSLGAIFDWKEDWRWLANNATQCNGAGTTIITNSATVWQCSVTTGTTTAFGPNTTTQGTYPVPLFAQIQSGTANTNVINVTTQGAFLADLAALTNQYAVFEWDAALSNAVLTNNVNVYAGLTNGNPSNVHPNGLYFKKLSGTDTNWEFCTDDGGTANCGAGSVAASTALQHFRIEFYGSATQSATKQARFYINSTLIGTSSSNFPTGKVSWNFTEANISTSNITMIVGSLHAWLNLYATPLAP